MATFYSIGTLKQSQEFLFVRRQGPDRRFQEMAAADRFGQIYLFFSDSKATAFADS
jgi:hypothetical protein